MQLHNPIDQHPTHLHEGFRLRAGKPYPFGASIVPGGVNFAVFSRHATAAWLVVFNRGERYPMVEIPFYPEFRVGNVFAMKVFDLDVEGIEYGYRMDGPYEPNAGHRFDRSMFLLDPYAKLISGRDVWGEVPDFGDPFPHRAQILFDDYDWGDDRPPNIPFEDLIIYEMHVRGFTRHPSSGVHYPPGTFAAMREKIPYLRDLGVNCVELMPVFEFDEFEYDRVNPFTGDRLMNYWGYSTLGFFAPKAGYAGTGKYGMQADEFKTLIKALHQSGIEVILDVAFNHTGEGNHKGKTLSFRGLDNKTYYMLSPDGSYMNFSGTGNTLNCNNPVVRNLVLECLRYWVAEYHIDGFRFDLASILGRDSNGMPLANPPLLEALAHDPILANAKLIAEAWDAGGLYQVGTFPAYGRWAEWNGKYRDTVRAFLKGDSGQVWEAAERIQGSPDLYGTRGTRASINFITCHDGFSLMDLYSYNRKHNVANGEDNFDGHNENMSWNGGHEGATDDPEILHTRRKMIKNAAAVLLVSQGVPMIHMGDEVGHSKRGNNNTYCHDDELNWFDWQLLRTNADLLHYFRLMIAFRKAHPVLRRRHHFSHRDEVGSGYPDISWHTTKAWDTNWSSHNRTLALMLCGKHAAKSGMPNAEQDDYVYIAMNVHWQNHVFQIPSLPDGLGWHVFANTALNPPNDICTPGEEELLPNQVAVPVLARSVVILVGKDAPRRRPTRRR
ncbi:MAG: glycogen debranching protein GlgX [Chloroflexi bacterium]|nr:glycogen debranching protein GlgX [Chloroflexota bacterium]